MNNEQIPWQLKVFKNGLKKNLRLKQLKQHLNDVGPDEKCLLTTCGDNNGAMNYFLRELGGRWSWADLEDTCIAEMSELLGDSVLFAADEKLPFEDKYFDMLKAGGSKHHKELLAPFGLDASDPKFWNKGLSMISGMIDELEAMEG